MAILAGSTLSYEQPLPPVAIFGCVPLTATSRSHIGLLQLEHNKLV